MSHPRCLWAWALWMASWLVAASASAASAPWATQVSDTINPGTADYIVSNLKAAEKAGAPCFILELDTPGGLLTSTRLIIQAMLSSRVPVVVFIGPRGAHAGSAGALITFAADVAAMAPGTNIGAAHPVSAGGSPDKTMDLKITNDTAAFAESLAKAKGRNETWAAKAVRSSESLAADQALKEHVIDLIADDVPDLIRKISGYRLKVAKHEITAIGELSPTVAVKPISIKQRVVSFFSDPNLSYLVLAAGGLCLWVELTHPGLVFPGVLGALCLVVSLVSFQTLPIDYGALALLLLGMGLLISELFLPTYGVLGLGGLVCFILGSLFLMDTNVPEFRISLGLIFPTAAVLAAFAFLLGYLVLKSRNTKLRSGVEAMIGEWGEVREPLSERPGKILIHGELWSAVARDGAPLAKGTAVVVNEVRGMLLVVSATK